MEWFMTFILSGSSLASGKSKEIEIQLIHLLCFMIYIVNISGEWSSEMVILRKAQLSFDYFFSESNEKKHIAGSVEWFCVLPCGLQTEEETTI